jgi:hypothetical protein
LRFCSAPNQNFFSNTSCQVECVTQNNPFWNAASIDFASRASGHAIAVLNGSRKIGAYSNWSTFFKYEVPNLESGKLKEVKVLLLHTPDQEKYETCKNPKTLQILETTLNEKNIKYSCEDNPNNIILLMCFQNPLSRECQAIKYAFNGSNSKSKFLKNYSYALFIFLVIFYLFI